MSCEFKLPSVEEAESRLDALFGEAFQGDHPALKDWIAIKFHLKDTRRKISDNSETEKPAHNSESKPCCKATFALVLEHTLSKVEKCPVCGTPV